MTAGRLLGIVLAGLLAMASDACGEPAADLVRQADQYGRLISTTQEAARKKAYGEQALALARQAVDANPRSANAQVMLAISYGRLARLLDHKTQISYASLIRDHAEKALALDPDNEAACHVLGAWNYEMANLNPILRTIAQGLYGKLPSGSNAEAIRYLTRAVELNPRRVGSRVDLGLALAAAGEKAQAREQFLAALALPDRDGEDAEKKKQAQAALRS